MSRSDMPKKLIAKRPKIDRPYRLELDGMAFSTTTYTTEERARDAASHIDRHRWLKPGHKWRITLRAPKGRKTTLIAEGVVK